MICHQSRSHHYQKLSFVEDEIDRKVMYMNFNRAVSSLITPEERQLALRSLNLMDAKLIAVGTEAEVYIRDENTVLKLYADTSRLSFLKTLQQFYESLDSSVSGLSLPKIYNINVYNSIIATVESR